MVITTRRDESPDCTICGAISCVMLIGFLGALSSQPINFEQLNWTTLCTTPGRALHGHSSHHSTYHSPYHYTTYVPVARVVTPAYKLILGSIVGFNLLYPHRFTHIYNCPTINYNTSESFYVGQQPDSEDLYNDANTCINTFRAPNKNILVIYPINGSVSISACGHHFLLDNNFQNYAEVE